MSSNIKNSNGRTITIPVIRQAHAAVKNHVTTQRVHKLLATFEEEVAQDRTSADASGEQLVPIDTSVLSSSRAGAARLLAALSKHCRFEYFVPYLASLLEVTETSMREQLLGVDTKPYDDGLVPGLSTLPIEAGPAWQGAITGFVKLEPGIAFPEHKHLGPEINFVLQGRMRDSAGELYLPGDRFDTPVDVEHHFVAEGPTPLIYVAILRVGIQIGDLVVGPEDPRL
jgi:ChrR Cupin-like domain